MLHNSPGKKIMPHRNVAKQDYPSNVNGSCVIFLVVMILLHFPNWSLRVTPVDAKHENSQKYCCVTSEHKIWWTILLYCCWNWYVSIFRHIFSLFFELWLHWTIFNWAWNTDGTYTDEFPHTVLKLHANLLYRENFGIFFQFYRMSQKSFPFCVVTKFNLKTLLWSLTAYQLQLLSIILRIHFI